MGKAEKRLEAMRANAKGWRYDEVAGILEAHGFVAPTPGTGSHRVFKHPSGLRVGLVEHGSGTLLPVYVKSAIKEIDKLLTQSHDQF